MDKENKVFKDMEYVREATSLQTTPISRNTLNNIFVLMLVVCAALLSFTNATITWTNIRNITAITIFLYIVTTAVYQNQYAKGKERGKTEQDYIDKKTRLAEVRASLADDITIDNLTDYCIYFQANELKTYRTVLLLQVNMKYSDYIKFENIEDKDIRKDKNLLRQQKRVIIKCKNAKPVKMTVAKLMSDFEGGKRNKIIFESGAQKEFKDKTINLVKRAFTTLFSGVITVDIIMNWSWQTLIQWGVRMMPVLTALIVGESAGFSNITVTDARFKEGQVECLLDFKKWIDNRPVKNTAENAEKIEKNQDSFPECSQIETSNCENA